MLNYVRILNLVFFVAVVFLGYNLYQNWSAFDRKPLHTAEVVQKNRTKDRTSKSVHMKGLLEEGEDHSLAFYQTIIDKNLFRPDRKSPDQDDPGAQEGLASNGSAGILRLVLYGVAMVGNERRALVGYMETDPATKQQTEKVRMVKVGDKLKEIRITAIEETSITLDSEQEPMTLNVYDPKDPGMRKRDRTVSLPPASSPKKPAARAASPKRIPAKSPQPRKID